jgi:hypothetical protein
VEWFKWPSKHEALSSNPNTTTYTNIYWIGWLKWVLKQGGVIQTYSNHRDKVVL